MPGLRSLVLERPADRPEPPARFRYADAPNGPAELLS